MLNSKALESFTYENTVRDAGHQIYKYQRQKGLTHRQALTAVINFTLGQRKYVHKKLAR